MELIDRPMEEPAHTHSSLAHDGGTGGVHAHELMVVPCVGKLCGKDPHANGACACVDTCLLVVIDKWRYVCANVCVSCVCL